MPPLLLPLYLGVLPAFMAAAATAAAPGAFVSNSVHVAYKPRLGGWRKMSSVSRQERPRPNLLHQITSTELMAPGFKVLSSGVSNGSNASPANTESLAEAHNIKASIKELHRTNAELKAEILALRVYMLEQGFTPVEDIFANPSKRSISLGTPITSSPQESLPASSKTVLPALPREVRLPVMALIWAAAVTVRGIFVPIAIAQAAAQFVHWLDCRGTLAVSPSTISAFFRGRGWRRSRARWSNAMPVFVPVQAFPATSMEGDVVQPAEAIAAAWNEASPRPRQLRY